MIPLLLYTMCPLWGLLEPPYFLLATPLQHTYFEEDDCMASFDVVSLFTKVCMRLSRWLSGCLLMIPLLTDRTAIPIGDLHPALSWIHLFLNEGHFYQQVQGAAMGSPFPHYAWPTSIWRFLNKEPWGMSLQSGQKEPPPEGLSWPP